MPRLLIARALHDKATLSAGILLNRVILHAFIRGYEIVDIRGPEFTRENLESMLELFDPDLVVLEGHGDPDKLGGHENEIVLDLNNVGELSGKIVFALSCNTAKILGIAAVDRKCKAYIGFEEEFLWVQARPGDPIEDPYAKWFFKPVLASMLKLVDGGYTLIAFKTLTGELKKSIDYWSRVDSDLSPLMLMTLMHDYEVSRLVGEKTAKVTVPTFPLAPLAAIAIPVGIAGTVYYMIKKR